MEVMWQLIITPALGSANRASGEEVQVNKRRIVKSYGPRRTLAGWAVAEGCEFACGEDGHGWAIDGQTD